MKKTVLTLGSALMLLATTTLHAQDALSFGVKGGGLISFPIIDKATINAKNYEGKWKLFGGTAGFFEYRLLDDMMGVGLEVGYSQKGLQLAGKKADTNTNGASKNNTDSKYCLNIHTIDITLPVAWLPMRREGGLSLFVGPRIYFALSTKEKEIGEKDSKKVNKGVIKSFNWGAGGGLKYEIAESGFFAGASYEHFVKDIFTDEQKAKDKKKELGLKEDDAFRTNGAQVFLGFDFARLLE